MDTSDHNMTDTESNRNDSVKTIFKPAMKYADIVSKLEDMDQAD